MFRAAIASALILGGCGPVEQPASIETVAAYEVALPSDGEKQRFLALLTEVSEAEGYHVDSASKGELEAMSSVSPISFNAAVWRGNDEENMASAMDFHDGIGRVWLTFPRGENPQRSKRFRDALVHRIKSEWPETASLPIMPSGAIPLGQDLIRTASGYEVKASAASRYDRME